MNVTLVFSIIIALLLFYYFYLDLNHIDVRSTLNNKLYSIHKTTKYNDLQKANILAVIDNKIDKLIHSLSSSNFMKYKLQNAKLEIKERMIKRDIAYTLNKGDVIGLCIEKDINTLFFVVLHELAHVVSDSFGHTEEFWKNFKTLIKIAVKENLYIYENYNDSPVQYCNDIISYTPLNKN